MPEPLPSDALPRRSRIPSGPRAQQSSLSSFRSTSRTTTPLSTADKTKTYGVASISSQTQSGGLGNSPLDALLDTEHDFTFSPETSPDLLPTSLASLEMTSRPLAPESSRTERMISTISLREKVPDRETTSPRRTGPSFNPFSVSRPSTSATSPPPKSRPKPFKLNTRDLLNPTTSPTKPVSPGLAHWQQVRAHVLAPTPVIEKPNKAKKNIVSRAAGKFGFRQAAENVLGYEERRRSTLGSTPDLGGMTPEEKEAVARERRKFARDVKTCLDACALEESRRRLQRGSHIAGDTTSTSQRHAPNVLPTHTFDPNFSSFAPLLMALHRHLPAARAKRPWSRTCPHHAAILAELGVHFLPDGCSTDGERQQSLEVFGVVVRNWSSDSAEEELDRWIWLCQALLLPDKHLRNRGLPLLVSFLNADPTLPPPHDLPRTAAAFIKLVSALLKLIYTLELTPGFEEHCEAVRSVLDLAIDGGILLIETASLSELLLSVDQDDIASANGLERELVWLALARCLQQSRELCRWIVEEEGGILERFAPSPLLHATPPVVLRLRALTTSVFFAAISKILRDQPSLSGQLWQAAETHLVAEVGHLPDSDNVLSSGLASMLLEFELVSHHTSEVNPFRERKGQVANHRGFLAKMYEGDSPNAGLKIAIGRIVSDTPLGPLTRMIQHLLTSKDTTVLGHGCITALFERLPASESSMEAEPLLRHLQSSHPQLLYKPLFALSAATNLTNVATHLRSVRGLSATLSRFWQSADPQMIVIVLMGGAGTKPSKGKGKEGERVMATVRLGRYACLVELLSAVEALDQSDKKGRALKTFAETIENRMSVLLEAQEKDSRLPDWYRALLCRLFYSLRAITLSTRRPQWLRLVVSWFCDRSELTEDDNANVLRSAYATLSPAGKRKAKPSGNIASVQRRDTQAFAAVQEDTYIKLSLPPTALASLVAMQGCVTKDEWQILLPHLWSRCGSSLEATKSVSFLLMKCGEMIPDVWHNLVLSELYSSIATRRSSAIHKLAVLYGWRYQLLSQLIVTDRRGPVFHFPARNLEFVATEIGSSQWLPPHDVQDAALRKFGTTLPLELRQRLMELGWTEEETVAGRSDWEQIPVTSLPSLQLEVDSTIETKSAPSSPTKSLVRRGSNGSGSSFQGKRRTAILAPVVLSMVSRQAAILAHDPESLVASSSRELLRLFQRDDPLTLLRPFTDGLGVDFTAALAELHAATIISTPAFAYAAMNAIVGYLKIALRTDATFGSYAAALATVSTLVPRVSGVSLRDIRKHKAEHVLLPASIHEEEGGFKLHAPWRDGAVDVQTAQLLILNEILRVNPREVYLFKKMLSNLQIQASVPHLPFARAWLILITTLFSTVNRNYNDRAELRHFLSNVVTILYAHGATDLLVASHALRVFMLCSARFRRLFASVGFSTVFRSVCELYAHRSNLAIKDAVEYTARSFYRIHQDPFVYQACVVIAEHNLDPMTAYGLLACLSTGNLPSSGVASGLRGLNDKEEVESLVQLLSGPELTFAEIGTDAAERQASKMAEVNLDNASFPKENITRLLITVIAADPTTTRASSFLRLFAGIVPHIKDPGSLDLLREGIEALCGVVFKGRTGDDAARMMFNPGDDTKGDWARARLEYIRLVESFAVCGGLLSSTTTKRTLDMVTELLPKHAQSVAPAAASILRQLARTHLHATGSRPTAFLREIAPLLRLFMDVVDLSGLLDEVTSFIRRASYDLDSDTTRIIIDSYVVPAVRVLAIASEDGLALIVPVRSATVDILSAAVFLQGDAFDALERLPCNPGLLASLVLPICLTLSLPSEVDNEIVLDAMWIRLLHYVIKSHKGQQRQKTVSSRAVAAMSVLSLQIVKIIVLRSGESLSRTPGLWHYVSRHVADIVRSGDGRFMEKESYPPRLIDWMMWSTYELISLHSTPLTIELRHLVQMSLRAMAAEEISSAPSSPGEGRFPSSPTPHLGRPRVPSARSPSIFLRPGSTLAGTDTPKHHPTHLDTHGRAVSTSSFSASSPGQRPSFADLSARRASKPTLAPVLDSAMHKRFPSSQSVRQLGGHNTSGKRGGAIVHLLGAPNQVLGATSAAIPTPGIRVGAEESARVLGEIKIGTPELQEGARRAVRSCKVVFGVQIDQEEEVRMLSRHEAIDLVVEQTRLLIEKEFGDVLSPSQQEQERAGAGSHVEKSGFGAEQITPYDSYEKRLEDEEKEMILPRINYDD